MKQINNTIPMLQVKKWKYRETRRIAERYTWTQNPAVFKNSLSGK